MSQMHNPPHPGETIREDILPALELTIAEAAQQLGIKRGTLSRLINGKAGISPDMALRLEAWLGGPKNGPSAISWLRQQSGYDLWKASQKPRPVVIRASRRQKS